MELSGWAEGISPQDEVAFKESTMEQLGKPDREIDIRPNSSHWVWIDGDVRVRYTNSLASDITGSRSSELEIAAYPALLTSDPATKAPIGGEDYLRYLKRGWGEDVGVATHKPLPKGLRGDVSPSDETVASAFRSSGHRNRQRFREIGARRSEDGGYRNSSRLLAWPRIAVLPDMVRSAP
jgi:hypothetical protein